MLEEASDLDWNRNASILYLRLQMPLNWNAF